MFGQIWVQFLKMEGKENPIISALNFDVGEQDDVR